MTLRYYTGARHPRGNVVMVHVLRSLKPLPPRNDLRNHSPTGFEWGYGGSGPAQLALAILAHHLEDDERALRLYQRFKEDVIAGLDSDSWRITSDEINRAIERIETKGAKQP